MKRGFYHDGRFATLLDVVNHNNFKKLNSFFLLNSGTIQKDKDHETIHSTTFGLHN